MRDGGDEYDIVIAGGGIVGAALACLLDGLALRIALVERRLPEAEKAPFRAPELRFDPRVSALNESSRRILDAIGIWGEVRGIRCCDYREMRVWDAEGTGAIAFSAAALGVDSLGTIVENSIVLARLYARLRRQENLRVISPFRSTSLNAGSGGGLVLGGDSGAALRTKLLVGADGADSAVRRLAGMSHREWDYGQAAVVTTVRTAHSHGRCARQRFLDTGPLAFLPLPTAAGGELRHSSIVWSTRPEEAEELLEMPDERFRARLAASIEHRLGEIEWSDRRFRFPLRQLRADSYVKHNIVLVGDAAHTIHPLAGQGVNLGLKDAAVLAEELRAGFAAGRAAGDPLPPRRFERRRKGENLGMMWSMEGLHRLFGAQPPPLRWLRNTGLRLVDRTAPLKNFLARRAIGS